MSSTERELDCFFCRELFSLHLENELDRDRKKQVEKHLEKCAACRGLFQKMEESKKTIVDLGKTRPAKGVIEYLQREQHFWTEFFERAGWKKWPAHLKWAVELSTIAAVLAVTIHFLPWISVVRSIGRMGSHLGSTSGGLDAGQGLKAVPLSSSMDTDGVADGVNRKSVSQKVAPPNGISGLAPGDSIGKDKDQTLVALAPAENTPRISPKTSLKALPKASIDTSMDQEEDQGADQGDNHAVHGVMTKKPTAAKVPAKISKEVAAAGDEPEDQDEEALPGTAPAKTSNDVAHDEQESSDQKGAAETPAVNKNEDQAKNDQDQAEQNQNVQGQNGRAQDDAQDDERANSSSTQPDMAKEDEENQSQGVLPRQGGWVWKGTLKVDALSDDVTDKVTEAIKNLGGVKAGQVELGWHRGNQRYYHFILPEENYDKLLRDLNGVGIVELKKMPHPRVIKQGHMRIIMTVEEAQ